MTTKSATAGSAPVQLTSTVAAFRSCARRSPQQPAVLFGSRVVSYGELLQCGLRVATAIRRRLQSVTSVSPLPQAEQGEVRLDNIVCVSVERSVELIVCMMAIQLAGAVYCPVHPQLPAQRKAELYTQTDCTLVLTTTRHASEVREAVSVSEAACSRDCTVLCVDELLQSTEHVQQRSAAHAQQHPLDVDEQQLRELEDLARPAYAIFTSGTTGKPKAAVISHRALATMTHSTFSLEVLQAHDVVLQVAEVTFDPHVWEVYSVLAMGCTVSMLRPGGLQDPQHMLDTIEQHRVTMMECVPSIQRQLVELCDAERSWARLSSLSRLCSGGEAFDLDTARHFASHLPLLQHINLYGPAEVTVIATAYAVTAADLSAQRQRSVPIGQALPSYSTHVVQPDTLCPVLDGVVGELLLGGPAVMLGYLRRAELSATALVHLPLLSSTPLYRTGDLVYVEPGTGLLHYVGRVDFQVKVNGQRIELGEIEACILQAPLAAQQSVEQVVVMKRALEGAQGSASVERLCAYVTLRASGQGECAAPVSVQVRQDERALDAVACILQHCRTQLPSYMVPNALTVLSSFPLSLNGKVQRQALPEPEAGAGAAVRGGRPATTQAELRVTAVWRAVLGLSASHPVDCSASFVQLGGNSLQQIRLAAGLSRAFARPVPVAELLRRATLEEQAAWLSEGGEQQQQQQQQAGVDWAPAGLQRCVASAAQQRFYLEEQRTSTAERSAYAVPIGPFHVACPASVEQALRVVEACIVRLVERHAQLRTALFVDEDSGLLHQRALSMQEWREVSAERGDVHAPLRVLDMDADTTPAQLRADTWRPLDLEAGSALRVRLVLLRRGASARPALRLHLVTHHTGVDGWSSGLLERDVRQLLQGVDTPHTTPHYTPTDWADYEARHVLQGEAAVAARLWWRERALTVQAGYRVFLPTLGPLVSAPRRTSCTVRLPAAVVRQVDELRASPACVAACGGCQPTRFLAYLALTQLWLAKLTGVGLGAALLVHDSGRSTHPMLADMVTCTVNTLVLPYGVDERHTFLDLLATCSRQWADTAKHAHTPITQVVADSSQLDIHSMASFNFLELDTSSSTHGTTRELDEEDSSMGEREWTDEWTSAEPLATPSAKSTLDIQFVLTTPRHTSLSEEQEAGVCVTLSCTWQDERASVDGDSLLRLLEQVAAQPSQAMEQHSLLPRSTVERCVELRLQAEQAAMQAEQLSSCVVQFVSTARRSPQQPAVLFGSRVVSYGELLQCGLRVATAIRRRLQSVTSVSPLPQAEQGEVRLDNIVCVSVERSVELIVCMMAIQLAGAVYCPVHPQLPAQRKAELYTQTDCTLVLTTSRTAWDVARAVDTCGRTADTAILRVDELLSEEAVAGEREEDERALDEAQLHDTSRPAYAIFTSGTTGKPKAAVISHLALATFTQAMRALRLLQPCDVVLQAAEVTFDASILEVFAALACECTVSVLQPVGLLDPQHVLDTISQHAVSFAFFVPSVLRTVVQVCEEGRCWQQLASFQRLSIGGEAFDVRLARRIRRELPHIQLWNGYGPAEVTVFSTLYQLSDAELHPDSQATSAPIGRALPSYSTHVVQPDTLCPVLDGVVGELLLGGPAVMLGYLRRAELSATALVHLPLLSSTPLYRTGDLVYVEPGTGLLHYVGRVDFQVKVNGQRIELGEIEACILQAPLAAQQSVEQVVVMKRALEGAQGSASVERLCAYVTLRASGQGECAAPVSVQVRQDERALDAVACILQHCRTQLPSYMVPNALTVLSSFPLSLNGKVQRQALPEPEAGAGAAVRGGRPATTQAELRVTAVWRAVLGLSASHPVDCSASFVQLGGNSLQQIRLAAGLSRAFARPVPVAELLRRATLEEQAAWLSEGGEQQQQQQQQAGVDWAPAGLQRCVASAAQQRFYLEEQRTSTAERSAYAVPIGPFHVACPASVEQALRVVEACIVRLVERHAQLRTALFVDEDSGLLHQRALSMQEWREVSAERGDVHAPLRVLDMDADTTPAQLRADTWRPLDLEAGSALRVRLVLLRRGASARPALRLHLVTHHTGVDGWSSGLLERDVRQLLQGVDTPHTTPHYTPTDWADYEARHVLQGEAAVAARLWWRERALTVQAGYRVFLPTLGPLVSAPRRTSCTVRLPAAVVRQVDELRASPACVAACGGCQPTRFLAYLALTQLWLAKLTGVGLGAALLVHDSGRSTHPMLADMVTCTVNTLVLPYGVDERHTFLDLLATCSRQWADTAKHAHTPITQVVADSSQLDIHSMASFNFLELDTSSSTHGTTRELDEEDSSMGEREWTDEWTSAEPLATPSAKSTLDIQFVLTTPRHTSLSEEQEAGVCVTLSCTWQDERASVDGDSLLRLLEQVAAQPSQAMEQHSLLPRSTVERCVELRLQAEQAAMQAEQLSSCVVQFVSTARRSPQQPAVLFGSRVVSYGELLQCGLRVATAIRRRLQSVTSVSPLPQAEQGEVRLDNIVCVSVERSVELIVCMMAIQLAGAVYCPVHPQLPAQRKAELYTQTDCTLVLTTSRTAWDVARAVDTCGRTADTAILRVDELLSEEAVAGEREEDERALDEAQLHDTSRPAYAIFTSGTTGKPKAAVISHLALATFTQAMRALRLLQPCDVVLQAAEVTFDASILEVFAALACECTVSVLQPVGLLDPQHVLDTISQHAVSFAFFVPSVLRTVVQVCEEGRCWQQLASFQRLSIGGEAFDVRLARRIRRELPHIQLWNGYGPAEVTVFSTLYQLSDAELHPDSQATSAPIGRALPSYSTHVVQPDTLCPVLDGVVGELLLGGPAVMLGYLRRAELSATALVHLPLLSSTPLYRTGDLVYVEPGTGLLHYVGRVDFQVKVNGQRIELGEIEACILQAPLAAQQSVEQVVVMKRALEGAQGSASVERLCAYVTLRASGQGECAAPVSVQVRQDERALDAVACILQHCRTQLPSYMVPNALTVLSSFPLSLNGKVQRQALPEPEAGAGAAVRGGRPATTQAELRVTAVWRAVLGLSASHPVDCSASFVQLGGNSLQQIRLAAGLSRAFARPVPVAELLRRATLEEQAAWLSEGGEQQQQQQQQAGVDWAPAGLQRCVASAAQQRFYLEEQRTSTAERSAYAVPIGPFHVACPASVEQALRVVEACIVRLVERHAQLRTALFVDEDSGLLHQRALSMQEWREVSAERGDVHAPLRVLDMDADTTPAQLRADTWRPLDLEAGSALRVRLVLLRRGASARPALRLHLVTHHTGVDGWSSGLLERDVRQLLQGVDTPHTTPHYTPTDWADYEARHVLQGEAAVAARLWWRERALTVQAGYRVFLPTLGPLVSAPRRTSCTVRLPAAVVRQVDELRASPACVAACGGCQPTRFLAYLALTQLWLAKLTGVGLGAALLVHDSGRSTHPMLADMVTCTVNTLVLPYGVDERHTFLDLLATCSRQWADTAKHAHTPITQVVADSSQLDIHSMASFNFLELDTSSSTHGTTRELDEEDSSMGEREWTDEWTSAEPLATPSAKSTLDIQFVLTTPRHTSLSEEQEAGVCVTLSCTWQDERASVDGDSLLRLLEQVAAQPSQAMEQHSLLPRSTVERCVELRLQAEQAAMQAEQLSSCVVQFVSTARRSPQQPAVLFGSRVVSYGELLQCGLRVATAIRRRLQSVTSVSPLPQAEQGEVRLDNIVCVSVERSVELIVCMMAIQLAGAVYCPVHPQLPAQRKAELYTQTDCTLVLTTTRHASEVREAVSVSEAACSRDCTVLCVDELLQSTEHVQQRSAAHAQQHPLDVDEQQLRELEDLARPAYAIFTSGTTGKPKAAVISHRALATMTHSTFSLEVLQAHDVVLQVAEVTFDPHVWEVYSVLAMGCTVSMLRPGGLQDPQHMLDTIEQHRVTVMDCAPAILRHLSELCDAERSWARLSSLQRLCSGGEAFDLDTARRLAARLPLLLHINLYGPAEVTVTATAYAVTAADLAAQQSNTVSIGRALPSYSTHVVQPDTLCPVLDGVVGELLLGGPAVMLGYLRRAELSATALVHLPLLSSTPLYRTGDLVYVEPGTGLLHYVGRVDFQVKVNGQRIELGEIEACILQAPLAAQQSVEQVVVMKRALEGAQGSASVERLCAYVTLRASGQGECAAPVSVQVRQDERALDAVACILQHCRTQLPSYMVPNALTVLSSFPLSLNGKVQRQALPEPEAGAGAAVRGGRPATTQAELRVTAVWRAVLGLSASHPVDCSASFVQLGGNSLQQIRLAAGLSRAFARPVPVAELLRRATLEEQAAWLSEGGEQQQQQQQQAGVDWAPAGLQRCVASAAQQRFYLEEQRTSTAERSAYAVPIGPFHVACPASVEQALRVVEACIVRLVERHAQLRTALFVDEDSGLLHQRALSMQEWREVSAERGDVHAPLRVLDMDADTTPAQLRADTWRPLDLEAGSALRVRLVLLRRGASARPALRLHLVTHHTGVDGWSSGLLERDVRQLLQGVDTPHTTPHYTPTDWADYEARHVLQGEAAVAARLWWRERALTVQAGYRVFLPTLGPLVSAPRRTSCTVRLPAAVVRQVDELRASPACVAACGGCQPTRFLAYLALTQLWLAKLTGVGLGAALLVHDSGRSTHPMLADMVTCTVNTLVLPYGVDERHTFLDLLATCSRQWADTAKHAHTPITQVVADSSQLDIHSMASFNFLELDTSSSTHGTTRELDEEDSSMGEREWTDEWTSAEPLATPSAKSTLDIQFVLTTPRHTSLSEEQEAGVCVTLSCTWQDERASVDGDSLLRLLEQVAAQPSQAMEQHSLLPRSTVERCVELRLQAEQAAMQAEQLSSCVVQFVSTARRSPQQPAVLFGSRVVSYGELLQCGLRVATAIRRRLQSVTSVSPLPQAEQGEVRLDNIVCVSVERSVELIVCMMAIQLAGAVYCPVHPQLPAQRKAELYTQTDCTLVLTTTRHASEVREAVSVSEAACSRDCTVLCVDELLQSTEHVQQRSAAHAQQHPLDVDEQQLRELEDLARPAYAIFTSGTTGKPKAAVISHRALATMTHSTFSLEVLQAHDVVLQVAEVTFDPHVWEVYSVLAMGCTVSMLRPGGLQDPQHMLDTIEQHRVTMMECVPSIQRQLVELCDAERSWARLSSLSRLCSGGEAFDLDTARHFASHLPLLQHINLYGPAEVTVIATAYAVTAADLSAQRQRSVPIGQALPSYSTHVVQPDTLCPVLDGVVGELLLGGPAVMLGYLRRAELSATALVHLPLLSSTPLYRTGDLVYVEPGTGLLHYVGRVDFQVKVNGQRIELGEIEACILQAPLAAQQSVEQVVVMKRALEGAQGSASVERLCAYVTLRASGQGECAAPVSVQVRQDERALDAVACILQHCRTQLPSYMVPNALTVLSSFPLSLNGKVQRQALPEPEVVVAAEVLADNERPSTDTERCIALCVGELLGLPSSSLSSTRELRDYGATSLTITRLTALLRAQLASSLSVASLFEHTSIRSLAAHIDTLHLQASRAARATADNDKSSAAAGRGPKSAEETFACWTLAARERQQQLLVDGSLRRTHAMRPTLQWLVALLRAVCVVLHTLGVLAVVVLYYHQWQRLSVEVDSDAALLGLEVGLLLSVYVVYALAHNSALLLWRYALFPVGLPCGLHQLHSWTHARIALYHALQQPLLSAPLVTVWGRTIFSNAWYRLAGCSVSLLADMGAEVDLPLGVEVHSHAVVASGAQLRTSNLIPGTDWYHIAPIVVGRHAVLRPNSLVRGGSTIGPHAIVHPMACVDGAELRRGEELSSGSLARGSHVSDISDGSPYTLRWWQLLHLAVLQLTLTLSMLAMALFPLTVALFGLNLRVSEVASNYAFYCIIPLWSFVLSVGQCVTLPLYWRLMFGWTRAGQYSLGSWQYQLEHKHLQQALRLWSGAWALLANLELTSAWLRLCGYTVGAGLLLDTSSMLALAAPPATLRVGRRLQMVSRVHVAPLHVLRGYWQVRDVFIGDDVFVGNNVVLEGGCALGDRCLVAALTRVTAEQDVSPGATMLGHPKARSIAYRHSGGDHTESTELRSWRSWGYGLAGCVLPFLALQLALGPAVAVIASVPGLANWIGAAVSSVGGVSATASQVWGLALVCVSVLLSAFVLMGALAIGSKWTLIGRYRATSMTLHSAAFHRRQLVGQLLGMWYSSGGLYTLDGTGAMLRVVRWLGARVGEGCVVSFDAFSEYDLLELGDHVTVEPLAYLQAHTFEDRVFKLDAVQLGRGSYCGYGSNPLPGSYIGADVQLAPFSLVLRGDTLLPGTSWAGSPLQQTQHTTLPTSIQVRVEQPGRKEGAARKQGYVEASKGHLLAAVGSQPQRGKPQQKRVSLSLTVELKSDQ